MRRHLTPRRCGYPGVGQTVLRGVNDDADTLEALMRTLVEVRVRPYYLHHGDKAPGTSHFRTTIAEGRPLMAELRRRLSGLALPTYVLDLPGAHGKVPLESRAFEINWENTACGMRGSGSTSTKTVARLPTFREAEQLAETRRDANGSFSHCEIEACSVDGFSIRRLGRTVRECPKKHNNNKRPTGRQS